MSIPDADPENVYSQEDQRRLRLVSCEHCARKDKALAAMELDMANAEAQMKAYRRQIGALKGELQDKMRMAPFDAEAAVIFEYWRDTLSPGARSFSGDRRKAVLARLNETVKAKGGREPAYSPKYVCEAIKGAAIRGKAYDLKWICKDGSNLEYCHGLYDAWVGAGRP